MTEKEDWLEKFENYLEEGSTHYRSPKTKQERTQSDPVTDMEPKARAKRNKDNLPTSYDDLHSKADRSWKKHRKTQYKPKNLDEETVNWLRKYSGTLTETDTASETNKQQLSFSPDMVVDKKDWDFSDQDYYDFGEAFREEHESEWKLSNGFRIEAGIFIEHDPEYYGHEDLEFNLYIFDSEDYEVAYSEFENVDVNIRMDTAQGGPNPGPDEPDSVKFIEEITVRSLDNVKFRNFHNDQPQKYDDATIKKFMLDFAKFILNKRNL